MTESIKPREFAEETFILAAVFHAAAIAGSGGTMRDPHHAITAACEFLDACKRSGLTPPGHVEPA